jgi:hypothetical protein
MNLAEEGSGYLAQSLLLTYCRETASNQICPVVFARLNTSMALGSVCGAVKESLYCCHVVVREIDLVKYLVQGEAP